MKDKRKKEIYSVLLVLILVGITIGYAVLSSNLNVLGFSKINNSTWDVHFNNVVINPESVTLSTGNQAATINPSDTTEVTYTVTLQKPGDFYEFNVDIVNGGTIDAMISSIVSKMNGTVIDAEHSLPVYLDYIITYSDGASFYEGNPLEAGTTETITVRLEFKKDISNEQLPTSDVTLSWSFGLSYSQSQPESIVDILHRSTVYTFGPEGEFVEKGNILDAKFTRFSTGTAARAANYSFVCLKHELEGDYVLESNLEFEVTQEMANTYPEMKAGVYTLRSGGATWDDEYIFPIESSIYYEQNKQILQTAFGTSNCEESEGDWLDYICEIEDIYIYADSKGDVCGESNIYGSCCSYGESSYCYQD